MASRVVSTVKKSKFMRRFPNPSIGALLVCIIYAFLLVIATFTPVPQLIPTLPKEAFLHPMEFFNGSNPIESYTRLFYYIPQIPVVLLIAATVGPRLGLLSVLMYVAAGISGLPVFAGGGGVDYFTRLGFGYILGFIPGIFTAGNILTNKDKSFLAFRAAIVGVSFIHITGIIYLILVLLFKSEPVSSILGWIWQLSGIQFFYDIIFGVLAVFLGRILRKILWIAMD